APGERAVGGALGTERRGRPALRPQHLPLERERGSLQAVERGHRRPQRAHADVHGLLTRDETAVQPLRYASRDRDGWRPRWRGGRRRRRRWWWGRCGRGGLRRV